MEVKPSINQLEEVLRASWIKDTSYTPEEWSGDNPARGQCAVSALVVQDYLGGKIIRFKADFGDIREKHYANLIEGELVDATRSQYPDDLILGESPPDLNGYKSLRERMLSDTNTAERYELLKTRVASQFDNQ